MALLLAGPATEATDRGVEAFACEALGENRRVLDPVRSVFAGVRCSSEDGARLIHTRAYSLRPGFERREG